MKKNDIRKLVLRIFEGTIYTCSEYHLNQILQESINRNFEITQVEKILLIIKKHLSFFDEELKSYDRNIYFYFQTYCDAVYDKKDRAYMDCEKLIKEVEIEKDENTIINRIHEMDFRLVSPCAIVDKYNNEIVFNIPVIVRKIGKRNAGKKTIPIIFDRLDFKTGLMKTTKGITFVKSMENVFDSMDINVPFSTSAMVYKFNDKIAFKVNGIYVQGIMEERNAIEIMNNDEDRIFKKYQDNYRELNKWVGGLNDTFYDLTDDL